MAAVLEQEATNTQSTSETATTIAATLAVGATAGNTLITACSTDKTAGTWTVPSGFTLIPDSYSAVSVSLAMAYKVATGGETTITWTTSNSEEHNMWVGEYSGLTSSPLDVFNDANDAESGVTSQTSGTTGVTAQADELAVAAFAIDSGSSVGTISFTNSFTLLQMLTDINSGNSVLWIVTKNLTSTGAVECTIQNVGGTADQLCGQVATFKEGAAPSSTSVLFNSGMRAGAVGTGGLRVVTA